MIFAMPKLEQALGRHRPGATGGGTVQAHTLRPQGIHPHQLLGQRALKGAPAGIVTQRLQHEGQPIIADVQRMEGLAGAPPQRVEPFLRPRLHVIQPMIRLREDMGQPDDGHPAQAEPLPVAMWESAWLQHPIRAIWASNNGISSTRSLKMVKVSFIPRPYHNVQNPFKFERTVS